MTEMKAAYVVTIYGGSCDDSYGDRCGCGGGGGDEKSDAGLEEAARGVRGDPAFLLPSASFCCCCWRQRERALSHRAVRGQARRCPVISERGGVGGQDN